MLASLPAFAQEPKELTLEEYRQAVEILSAQVQILSEALEKCSQQFFPRIMQETQSNFALFGRVECFESYFELVNELGEECKPFMIYDNLIQMKLEEMFPPDESGIDIIWEKGNDS
jgi:hypothetical protein